MVDLSIIEQKIKDDPEIDQSVKDTLPKEKEDEEVASFLENLFHKFYDFAHLDTDSHEVMHLHHH